MRINRILSQARDQTGRQIEKQIAKMAKAVFHVITEDDQGPHIKNQVQPSAMQKHRSKEGNHGLRERPRTSKPFVYPDRYQSKGEIKNGLVVVRKRSFKQKHEHVQRDKEIIDKWTRRHDVA